MMTISTSAKAVLDSARLFDMATELLIYECESCSGQFDEAGIEAALGRAVANINISISPELEAAMRAARIRDDARALLIYHCGTCTGGFDEATVEAVLKWAATNAHGAAITPQLEAALR